MLPGLSVRLGCVLVALFLAQAPSFNPRDFSGVWWVDNPGSDKLMARGRAGDASKCQTCHLPEHTLPEPPVTTWAREHPVAPRRSPCEPIGLPAQFWHTQLAPFEFVVTSDRVFQFFESHNEWRAIWLNRGHPADPEPTYMGDSVGTWDGDTLVVDTIGFNGRNLIEPVAVDHTMSDAFHLVERWRRPSRDRIELEATYFDPKVWGDQPWRGLTKTFVRQTGGQLMESYCSPEDNAAFDEKFVKPGGLAPK